MKRGESNGFRLGNAETSALVWLFTQSDAEIAGIAGQSYEPRMSSDTSPEHLFLQERLVSFGDNDNITRQNRLRSIARRMTADDPKAGWDHWKTLQKVYGQLSPKDPHDHFGRELAPLAKSTPAALERAEKRWPHWHVEKHAERYEALYGQLRRDLGAGADVERLMRLLPDNASAAGEQEEILSFVVDGACSRAFEASRPMTTARLSPADESLLKAIERQADAMLSSAGLSFQEAAEKVDEDLAEEGRAGEVRFDTERVSEVRLIAARAEELLKLSEDEFKELFWANYEAANEQVA